MKGGERATGKEGAGNRCEAQTRMGNKARLESLYRRGAARWKERGCCGWSSADTAAVRGGFDAGARRAAPEAGALLINC